MGGLIAILTQFVRTIRDGAFISEAVGIFGGDTPRTTEHFADSGDDSHPIPGDCVATLKIARSGGATAVGYLDPRMAPKAQAGEKRIYARSAPGTTVVELWLKNDGTAVIENDAATFTVSPSGSIKGANGSGVFELRADGVFEVNGATISTSGAIDSPTAITSPLIAVDGKELKDHTHPILTGSSEGTTGTNN